MTSLRPDPCSLSSFGPLLFALTLAVSPAPAAEPPEPQPAHHASGVLLEALRSDRGPGVQAAVLVDGKIVWSEALGLADLEASVAMERGTRLRIGSVSKVFTAALAAHWIAEGRLDPDSVVHQVLPTFPSSPAIPIHTLANHTSGIRHYDFSNLAEANNTHRYDHLADALALFQGDPLLHEPGSAFHYSSFGFNLLGVVVEAVSGEPFLDGLERRLLHPLELDGTGGDRPWAVIPERGRFYTVTADGVVINTLWRDSSDYYPSGGLLSTAEDLVHLAWESFEPSEEGLLAGRPRDLLSTPTTLADGTALPYTFGWQHGTTADGSPYFGHGGLTNGATAEVRFYPRQRLAVAVIANYNFWFEGTPAVITSADSIAALFDPP